MRDISSSKTAHYKRFVLDKFIATMISSGGILVIAFIFLIFFYLFRQVMPLFQDAEVTPGESRNLPPQEQIVFADINEYNDVIFRLDAEGRAEFYNLESGIALHTSKLPLRQVSAISADAPRQTSLALADETGGILFMSYKFKDTFDGDIRTTTGELSYPLGEQAVVLSPAPLRLVSSLTNERSSTLVGYDAAGELHGKRLSSSANPITGEITLSESSFSFPPLRFAPHLMQLYDNQRHLVVASRDGRVLVFDLQNDKARVKQELNLGYDLLDIEVMLGSTSILMSGAKGAVSQWFMVQGDADAATKEGQDSQLRMVRDFSFEPAVVELVAVRNSKSFLALNSEGDLSFMNSPAEKESFNLPIANDADEIAAIAISPRADGVLFIDKLGQHSVLDIYNPHPGVSMKRLIGKVWYEGYSEPDYVWQSTAGSNEFEPKFSLVPLSFGSIKAAIYAMIFSVPLAIAGAIYTAFFMGSRLRRKVKPIVETMEAFPTVIIGFLAGIIVAPYFEKHLPGIFSILLLLPPTILLFGFLLRWARARFRPLALVSESMLMIPVFLLLCWAMLQISPSMENFLFGGVPRLMVNGAYALGATPLQNTVTIVIPAALSGILSAIMIGFGRAVGETMIVLMATGNTPVMDMNIFTGMRTLSANIAIELPEAAAGSTHFRVLFLCGLLLLLFCFFVNILTEVIRQRIRKTYANI